MMEQELINIWQSSNEQERIKFDRSRLIIELQSSLGPLQKVLQYRDFSDLLIALIMIPIIAYAAYSIPSILSKIGAFLIAMSGIFTIGLLINNLRKNEMNIVTTTYIDYLQNARNYLLAQRRLLDAVPYCFILPITIGLILTFSGMNKSPQTLALLILITLGLGMGAYFFNRLIWTKTIQSRLTKVDELLKVINE